MEMPTPCIICNETFDFDDGRIGLTHLTSETIICQSCRSEQDIEIERVDEIRSLLEKKRRCR